MLGLVIFLKKAWAWLKNNWWIPVVGVVAIIAWIFFRPAGNALLKLISRTRKRHREEIEGLERIRVESLERKAEAQKEHDELIDREIERYEEEQKQFYSEKSKRVDDLVEEHRDDPEALTQHLAELGGIRVVESREK